MSRIAIMQPYLFPYIGYFQLIKGVDEFVVYDNIQYTKKGWINRNRILVNGKDEYISVPLKKDSDYLDIKERFLADTWGQEKKKLLNKITEVYRKAPFFKETQPVVESCLSCSEMNLFEFIFSSLKSINSYLEINTPLIVSSTLDIDHSLKADQKVIAICKALNATQYLNPIGGMELYSKEQFMLEGIELQFHKATNIPYQQFNSEYVPFLSVIDVMMFNSKEKINEFLINGYSVI